MSSPVRTGTSVTTETGADAVNGDDKDGRRTREAISRAASGIRSQDSLRHEHRRPADRPQWTDRRRTDSGSAPAAACGAPWSPCGYFQGHTATPQLRRLAAAGARPGRGPASARRPARAGPAYRAQRPELLARPRTRPVADRARPLCAAQPRAPRRRGARPRHPLHRRSPPELLEQVLAGADRHTLTAAARTALAPALSTPATRPSAPSSKPAGPSAGLPPWGHPSPRPTCTR